jgi:hypothetical protein
MYMSSCTAHELKSYVLGFLLFAIYVFSRLAARKFGPGKGRESTLIGSGLGLVCAGLSCRRRLFVILRLGVLKVEEDRMAKLPL